MQLSNPYQQYKEQSLSTLTPGELLIKLFDELAKQMSLAKLKIESKDYAAVNDSLQKCQTIVQTLAGSLDMRYPISGDLKNMYAFLSGQLLQANLKKNSKILSDCLPLVRDLRDSFDQAEKISRKQSVQRSTVNAIGGRPV